DGHGVDKPYPSDGQPASTQGPGYYDGNNGCGQDRRYDTARDFQGGYDDNNGHCGRLPSSPAIIAPATAPVADAPSIVATQPSVPPAPQSTVAPATTTNLSVDAPSAVIELPAGPSGIVLPESTFVDTPVTV